MKARMMKTKFKFWTGCFNERGQKLVLGMPFTNLRDAKATLHQFNSSRAGVVRADSGGSPTTELVAVMKGPR